MWTIWLRNMRICLNCLLVVNVSMSGVLSMTRPTALGWFCNGRRGEREHFSRQSKARQGSHATLPSEMTSILPTFSLDRTRMEQCIQCQNFTFILPGLQDVQPPFMNCHVCFMWAPLLYILVFRFYIGVFITWRMISTQRSCMMSAIIFTMIVRNLINAQEI